MWHIAVKFMDVYVNDRSKRADLWTGAVIRGLGLVYIIPSSKLSMRVNG